MAVSVLVLSAGCPTVPRPNDARLSRTAHFVLTGTVKCFRNKINQAQLSAQIMFLRFLRYNMKIWFSCGVIRGPHNNMSQCAASARMGRLCKLCSVMHFFTWRQNYCRGRKAVAGNVVSYSPVFYSCLCSLTAWSVDAIFVLW